ncbi:MAG: hypothetical protein ACRD2L_18740, partial [Terriglobia bacterium]
TAAAPAKGAADKEQVVEKAAAERAADEKVAAERLAQIKAAQEKEAAEQVVAQKKKAAQEKAVAEKAAQERAAAEKATIERAVAEKAAAERAAAKATAAPSVQTRQLQSCPPDQNQSATWTNCVGTWLYRDGSKYVGGFMDGKFNGQGIITSPHGSILRSGTWDIGNFVEQTTVEKLAQTRATQQKEMAEQAAAKTTVAPFVQTRQLQSCPLDQNQSATWTNCVGTWLYRDGSKYVGGFRDGKFNGQGTITSPNGSILRSGTWESGNFVGGGSVAARVTPESMPDTASFSLIGRWKVISSSPTTREVVPAEIEVRPDGLFTYRNAVGSEMSGSAQQVGNLVNGIGRMKVPERFRDQRLRPFPDGTREATFAFTVRLVSEKKGEGTFTGGGDSGTFDIIRP